MSLPAQLPVQHQHAILDRSGSMNGKTEDVIGGFRANIQNMRNTDDFNIMVSAKMFDHEEELILRSTNVKEISDEELDSALQSYVPRGQTGLRDALGNSITHFMNYYLINEQFHSCMIYVMTDGLENCSRNPLFYPDKLKELIERAERECNIKVFYVGSNQDAILNAASIGIPVGQAMNFVDSEEVTVQAAFRSLSSAAERMRSNEVPDFVEVERANSIAVNHATIQEEDIDIPLIRRQ